MLKPAPSTSLVGLRIGELARKVGLPAGVLNVVTTDDGVAAALVEDPRLGKIVFTGSVATGRKVMAAAAAEPHPGPPRARGKGPRGRLPRRGPRPRGPGDRMGRLRELGPDLRVRGAGLRRAAGGRGVHRQGRGGDAEAPPGRSPGGRGGRGAAHDGAAAQDRGRARRGREGAWGAHPHGGRETRGRGILLSAHRAHERRSLDEDHAGGDVRPRAPDHGGRLGRRGDPPRQRQRLRPHRQRLDSRPRHRAAAAVRAPGGRRHDQRSHEQLRGADGSLGRRQARAGSGARTGSPGCARWFR